MKKLLTLCLAGVMSFACLLSVGCGGTVISSIDETKTQIYVANYNGGGTEKWLDIAAEEFEEMYKNTSFEEGKTGVEVIVDHGKGHDGNSLAGSMAADNYEIYFSNNVYYQDFVNQGLMMDITDLVTGTSEYDNKKIFDKLYDADKENLKVNDKYYALPYYELTSGISYDAGIFNTKNLFFSNEIDNNDTTYPGTRKFISLQNRTKSCGPDGETGTYDDGLPSSVQEFYKLIDKMITVQVTPFVYHPGHYTNQLISTFYVNLLGGKGTQAIASMDSQGEPIEVVTSINDNGTVKTDDVVITRENAYLVKESSALYYALEVAKKVYTKEPKYVDVRSYSSTFSHLNAMEAFLYSGIDGVNQHIGMLIEGNYWYNEADDDDMFIRFKENFPDTYSTKDIKFMPVPRQYSGTVTEEEEGSAPVFASMYHTYAMINANVNDADKEWKKPLVKKFLSFVYSDDKLCDYTVYTNGLRIGVKYDYEGQRDKVHTFAQSLMDMRSAADQAGTFIPVRSSNSNRIYATAERDFSLVSISPFWASGSFTSPLNAFHNGKSAKDYFTGMSMREGWAERLN